MLRTCCALLLGVWMLGAQVLWADELPGILIIEITGLKDATGNVYIAVYDSDADWLSDDVVQTKAVAIDEALDGDVVRTEVQLPMGEYAVSVFHDQDGDGELTTNFLGMPKEPIAVSNNAVARFGPPEYEDAVFQLGAEPLIQRITMREL